jgi:uncharacterized membrane protein
VPGSMTGSGGIELPNRGEIRFQKRGDSACHVQVVFEFEVPGALSPFVGALTPFGNRVLARDMKVFAEYAEQAYAQQSAAAAK